MGFPIDYTELDANKMDASEEGSESLSCVETVRKVREFETCTTSSSELDGGARADRDALPQMSCGRTHGAGGLGTWSKTEEALQGMRKAVSADSFQKAQHVQPGMPSGDRTPERDEALASRALSNRTKRLRALGNAVVPQIAEWIARRL